MKTNLEKRLVDPDRASGQTLSSTQAGLFLEKAIDFAGKRYTPDESKAYIEFRLGYPYPVVTAYGSAFHAGTIANSAASMRHQGFNLRHEMAANSSVIGKEIREDRMLGSILEIEYPDTPAAGWKLSSVPDSPSIHGLAVANKRAKGMKQVLGEHLSGKHEWTVSLEVKYDILQGGALLVPSAGGDQTETPDLPSDLAGLAQKYTPDDFASAGLWYVPFVEAPDGVIECWDMKKGRFTKAFNGRDCVHLIGGIDGSVHFWGVGLVEYGAEPTATVGEMVARDPGMDEMITGLGGMVSAFEKLIR